MGSPRTGRRDRSWATALTNPRLTCGAGFRRSFTPRSRSCHHPSPGSAYPEELALRAFGALPEHRALKLSVPAKRTSRQRSSHSSGSSAQPATPRSRRQQEAKARRRGHNGLEGPGAGDAGVTGQSLPSVPSIPTHAPSLPLGLASRLKATAKTACDRRPHTRVGRNAETGPAPLRVVPGPNGIGQRGNKLPPRARLRPAFASCATASSKENSLADVPALRARRPVPMCLART